jgi:hypothetical protein
LITLAVGWECKLGSTLSSGLFFPVRTMLNCISSFKSFLITSHPVCVEIE